ncbi:MAG TPA: response regulator [Aggregatilineales bacterium]|nr:response regulator [Aggregatilineales bacterium]
MAKILLVEDDIPLRRLYESALELEHMVIPAGSSSTAIQAIDAEQPDLVVLDLHLPDAPGTAVLDHIESRGGNLSLRVVVMTGFAHFKSSTIHDCIIEILNKPVTTSMLLRVVNAAIASRVK